METVKFFSLKKNSFVTIRPLNDGRIILDSEGKSKTIDLFAANSSSWGNTPGMWTNSSSWSNSEGMWTNSSSWSNRDDMWTNSSSWSNRTDMWTNSSSWSNSEGMWTNSSSWSNSDSGGCYLTTACMLSINGKDDCQELMILRDFRDKMIDKDQSFKSLVIEYYKKAPLIVNKIEKDHFKKEVYNDIYSKTIEPCVNLIKEERYEDAVRIYADCYKKLKAKYKVK